jgi:hypothetical protein
MYEEHYIPTEQRPDYSNYINWIILGGLNHDSCHYELKEMKIEAAGFEIGS